MTATAPVDVVVFGGGAAGLWLLDELHRAGFGCLLLEAHELGSGQTIASQGIIHGGLKYTLSGLLTPSARAISNMPTVWRRCLAGESQPDLSATRLRAQFCYLWRTSSITSKLAMIGAKAGLQVSPRTLGEDERPAALMDCPGTVARLDEQVIEPASFIADLSWQHRQRILKIDAAHGLEFAQAASGEVNKVRLINPESGQPLDLVPRWVVLTAGAGNADLRKMMGLKSDAMQRRPLHMVMARSAGGLPKLNGHCVDGSKTRVTITSTEDAAGRTVWQIGGQVAEDGVTMELPALVAHAVKELRHVLPSMEFHGVEWSAYRVDRAEAMMRGGKRPEDARAMKDGNIITAWPTKLALAPHLASMVMNMLDKPTNDAAIDIVDWPRPIIAAYPWERNSQWTVAG